MKRTFALWIFILALALPLCAQEIIAWPSGVGGTGDILADGSVPFTNTVVTIDGTSATPAIASTSDFDGAGAYFTNGYFNVANNGVAGGIAVAGLTCDATGCTLTGPLNAPAGTAAVPSISWSSDPDTGLFSQAAGIIGATHNGVESYRWGATVLRSSSANTSALGSASFPWSYGYFGTQVSIATIGASALPALYVNASGTHTGRLIEADYNGVDKFWVDKDGFVYTTVVDSGADANLVFKRNGATMATIDAFKLSLNGPEGLYGNGRVINGHTSGIAYAQTSTPYALGGTSSNQFFSNSTATGKIEYTLPDNPSGMVFRFYVADADGIRITAASGDTITVSDKVTAGGGYVESTTIGSVITVVGYSASVVVAHDTHGVWTDGTFTFDDTGLTTP